MKNRNFTLFCFFTTSTSPPGERRRAGPMRVWGCRRSDFPSISSKFNPQTTLLCRDLKSQKCVKNGHFLTMTIFWSSGLWGSGRVGRLWIVGLLHIMCACYSTSLSHLGQVLQSCGTIKEKTSNFSFFSKKQKTQFLLSRKIDRSLYHGEIGSPN